MVTFCTEMHNVSVCCSTPTLNYSDLLLTSGSTNKRML